MPELDIADFYPNFTCVQSEISRVIVGHSDVIEGALICLFAGGHALLEGVPGLGKTRLVRAMASSLSLRFSRVQFTPDLMPADVTGTNIVVDDGHNGRSFRFQPGPLFGNIILADEINRATPKTQSSMLEAMQEHSVTVSGTTYVLEEPFTVLATQNPVDMEGTYPLPEAQLDRFMLKLVVGPPSLSELTIILERTTDKSSVDLVPVLSSDEVNQMRRLAESVPIASHVREYAARLVLATHSNTPYSSPLARQYVQLGASPRGAQSLVRAAKIKALLDRRFNVAFEDINAVAQAALRHRLIFNFDGETDMVSADAVINECIKLQSRKKLK